QGTSVVLLDRPLAAPAGKPFPTVVPAPLAASARSLVEAALADAKTAKLPADGKALILIPNPPDVHTEEIRDAFQAALKGAGVAGVETVEYNGTIEGAGATVAARLKQDPKLTLVLAASGDAISGTLGAREKARNEHLIIVAGFTEAPIQTYESAFGATAAVADRNVLKVARDAFAVALRLAAGESVPDRTEVPVEMHRFASTIPEPPQRPGPGPGREPVQPRP